METRLKGKSKGFTFLELTVVIFLIGLTLLLTVPRFRSTILTDDLKKTVRRMVGTVRTLRNEAIRDQKVYSLHFDIESNRVWTSWEPMNEEERRQALERAYQIPDGIRILDVWRGSRGKEVAGDAVIHFSKKGYIEQSVIHLAADDGRQFTLILSPFLGRVKVVEEYVEFAET